MHADTAGYIGLDDAFYEAVTITFNLGMLLFKHDDRPI